MMTISAGEGAARSGKEACANDEEVTDRDGCATEATGSKRRLGCERLKCSGEAVTHRSGIAGRPEVARKVGFSSRAGCTRSQGMVLGVDDFTQEILTLDREMGPGAAAYLLFYPQ